MGLFRSKNETYAEAIDRLRPPAKLMDMFGTLIALVLAIPVLAVSASS